MKAAEIMGESDSATEQIASGALHALAPRLSSLHSDAEMTKASIGGAATIGLAAHGFADGADLADSGNRLTQEGGLGFAQAVVSQAQLAGAKSRPDVKNGYGTVLKDGKFVDGMSAEGGRAAGLLRTIGQGDFVQAKGGFLKKMGGTIKEQISAGRSQEAQDAHKAVVNLRGSGMSDDDIKKQAGGQRLLQMAEQHGVAESLAEELKLAASPYSSSPVDTKGEAKRLVDELGMQGELESMVAEQKLMQEREAGAAGIGGGDSGGGDSGGGAAAAGGGE